MSGRTVLVGAGPAPWAAQRARATDRLLARLLGASLDRRLAAGQAPEASRLLAVRGQQIVELRHRRQLAVNWEHLLAMAADGPPNRPRALLCRGRIVAAAAEIGELAAHLRAPLPVAATGVAAAQVLLTDATGPVYNRRDHTGLDTRLRAISALLDPAAPLQSLVRSNT